MPTVPLPPGAVDPRGLRGHRCHFRFADGLLELDEPRPTGCFLLELEAAPDATPTVELRVAGALTRAHWRPGGPTFVAAAWAGAHPGAVTGAGEDTRLGACRIGGVDFAAHPCVVTDAAQTLAGSWSADVVLGDALVRTADWLFDFPAKAWAVTDSRP